MRSNYLSKDFELLLFANYRKTEIIILITSS